MKNETIETIELKSAVELAAETPTPQPEVIEPTPEEVEAHRRAHSLSSSEDARRQLLERATAEAARLRSIAPDSAEEEERAIREVREAAVRAEEIRASRREAIASLEAQILNRAKLRAHIAQVQALADEAGNPEAAANAAVDAFLLNLTSPCAANSSAWEHRLQRMTQLAALRPFLPSRIKAMEKQAAQLLAQIRETARENRIDLQNLLAVMRVDAQQQQGAGQEFQLFAHGFADLD